MTATPIYDFDYLAKILFLGDLGVGKTTFWYRYSEGVFVPSYCITPGIDFRIKNLEIDGKKAKMQIWDSSGRERFGPLPHSYYRNVHGIILCYGIDNRNSFERVEYWIEEIRKYANEDVCIVLVGTKSDLNDERVVSIDEGREKAGSLGVKFFEVSAKENTNLDETVFAITRDIGEVLGKKNSNGIPVPATRLHSKGNNSTGNCLKCS